MGFYTAQENDQVTSEQDSCSNEQHHIYVWDAGIGQGGHALNHE